MWIVIGRPGCVYCTKACTLLKETGHEYRYIDITSEANVYYEIYMQQAYRLNTVPQIWDNKDKHIGGYKELMQHLNQGKL